MMMVQSGDVISFVCLDHATSRWSKVETSFPSLVWIIQHDDGSKVETSFPTFVRIIHHHDGPKWRRHFLRLCGSCNIMMVQSRDVISFVCLDHTTS